MNGEEEMIRFDCPACGKKLKMPPSAKGKKGRCPKCDFGFTTPSPGAIVPYPVPLVPVEPTVIHYIHVPDPPKDLPRARVVGWAFIACPSCARQIKVPTHKGTLDATCPGCQKEWEWDPECDDWISAPPPVAPPPPAPPPPKPTDYPTAFVWWRDRSEDHKFPFPCQCGVVVPLRQRVVLSKRVCPGCGREITIADIDACLDASEYNRKRTIWHERVQ